MLRTPKGFGTFFHLDFEKFQTGKKGVDLGFHNGKCIWINFPVWKLTSSQTGNCSGNFAAEIWDRQIKNVEFEKSQIY